MRDFQFQNVILGMLLGSGLTAIGFVAGWMNGVYIGTKAAGDKHIQVEGA